jgi:hypothetical protein
MMTFKRASDLSAGDVFRMHIYGEVIAITPVAGGKRIKIKIELENQGHRSNGVYAFSEGDSTLEFTDDGHVLEFLCRPGRKFHVYDDWGEDNEDDDCNVDAPTPQTPVAVD